MRDKKQAVINHIFGLMVIAVFFYFIAGELCLPSNRESTGVYASCTEYEGSWERIHSSGAREAVTVPGKCQAKRNEIVVLETRLPDVIDKNQYLCFRSAKQEMRFWVDGVLRQTYSTKEGRLFGKLSAVAYVFVKLDDTDAGKVLRVETQTDSSYSGIFYTVYSASPLGMWRYLFQRFGTELLVAFLTLILSLIVIAGTMALRIGYHRRVALEYLGWGILFAAVWLIANATFRQLLFPNLSVINDISFLMIMLLALPYLIYMNEIQKGRYHRLYQVMEVLVTINFFICSALHMGKWYDFTETFPYVAACCILSIAVIGTTIVLDWKKGRVKEYLFVALGMFVVCLAAVIQIIVYFQRVRTFNGVILAVGLIFLLLFSTINAIREIIEMDRAKQQALAASESKGRFLAHMSHEIRTPIHAVLGMDEMILRESREPQIRAYALDIQNAGQTLLSLINDVLDISKIESGKLEILPVDYDFSSLIHDVVNMMELKAQDKGLEFLLSVDAQIPSRLFGDDVRLRQILVNLLTNAVKYTQTGSVALRVGMESQEPESEAVRLLFRVEDTGVGIRQQDMEKLFRAFERIEEEKNRTVEGTGLGMSITVQLLELMGTKLEVASVYGKGSVFSFTLLQQIKNREPIGDLDARIRRQSESNSYQPLFSAPQVRLLIVDDNAVNRRVLLNLLKSTQVQVTEASDGAQCLEYVQTQHFDLIFLDHMMPEMDGIEVLHRMQTWSDYPCKQTPVVALTANAVTGAREMYLAEGFADFLSKPVRPEKLEKMLMELLPQEKIEPPSACVQTACTESVSWEQLEALELEGIDLAYARLHCLEHAIFLETIRQFYEMIGQEGAHLEKAFQDIAASDGAARKTAFASYRIQVHAMKSAAAMIGALALSGAARLLEDAAREEVWEVLETVTPRFLADWQRMRVILEPAVCKPEAEEKQKFDSVLISTCLRLLNEALAELDIDTADAALAQLRQFAYPTDAMRDALVQLGAAVSALDEEQVRVWSARLEQEIENG